MRALPLLVLLVALPSTALAGLREDLGEARAAAVDSAFAAAVPGATLEWQDTLSVILPDGARSEVNLIGPVAFQTMYVLHAEITGFAKAAVVHARTFSSDPAPTHPTDFLAAVPASGTPRIVRLDPTGISIEIKDLDVVPEYETPQTWPAVNVTYWAQYASTDWVGSVRWTGTYDMETKTDLARMPMTIAKRRATGDGILEAVVPTRATAEIVEIEGGQTRQIVQYPCPIPCTFDGRSLLAAWGVATGAAIAE